MTTGHQLKWFQITKSVNPRIFDSLIVNYYVRMHTYAETLIPSRSSNSHAIVEFNEIDILQHFNVYT